MEKQDEWKAKFKSELGRRTSLTGKELDDCCESELENWIDSGEWEDYPPEDAVSENLSYWND